MKRPKFTAVASIGESKGEINVYRNGKYVATLPLDEFTDRGANQSVELIGFKRARGQWNDGEVVLVPAK
jgi:hypothetical protein